MRRFVLTVARRLSRRFTPRLWRAPTRHASTVGTSSGEGDRCKHKSSANMNLRTCIMEDIKDFRKRFKELEKDPQTIQFTSKPIILSAALAAIGMGVAPHPYTACAFLVACYNSGDTNMTIRAFTQWYILFSTVIFVLGAVVYCISRFKHKYTHKRV